MSAIVGTLGAEKGGVGKTLQTQNLGGAFVQMPQGPRVLLIDADPQASLSKNTFGSETVERLRPYQTTAALYDASNDPVVEDLVHATSIENLFIVPASDHLAPYRLPQPKKHGELQFVIRDFVHELGEQFDVILIDTPGSVDTLPAWGALLASDFVFSPVQPEKNSCEAVIGIKRILSDAVASGNPGLTDLGYFVNNLDARLAIHKAREIKLRRLYGPQVFDTVLHARKSFKEAVEEHKPITHVFPDSEEAKSVRALAHEIIARIRRTMATTSGQQRTEHDNV